MEYLILASYGEEVGAVVAIGLAVGVFLRWFWSGDLEPDPWEQSDETEECEDEEPVCQRCLQPVSLLDRGCNNCGAMTSPIAAFAPFPASLSVGDAMRAGIYQRHPKRIVLFGCIFISLIEFTILAPIYIYFFFRNRRKLAESPS